MSRRPSVRAAYISSVGVGWAPSMAVSSSGRATLLLLLLQALSRQPVTAYTPTSNAQLKQAAFDWCQDPVAAEATYGAHIKDWDTSQITSMTELFMTPPAGCTVFNDDISGWDVSNVGDMSYMFHNAQSFNVDIVRAAILPGEDSNEAFRSSKLSYPALYCPSCDSCRLQRVLLSLPITCVCCFGYAELLERGEGGDDAQHVLCRRRIQSED